VKYETFRRQEAVEPYRRSGAIQREAAEILPSARIYRQRLASALLNLGAAFMGDLGAGDMGYQPGEAEDAFREARTLLEKLTADSPEQSDGYVALGGVLNNLAILRTIISGDLRASRQLLEEAVAH
jgi:hypothetical protein